MMGKEGLVRDIKAESVKDFKAPIRYAFSPSCWVTDPDFIYMGTCSANNCIGLRWPRSGQWDIKYKCHEGYPKSALQGAASASGYASLSLSFFPFQLLETQTSLKSSQTVRMDGRWKNFLKGIRDGGRKGREEGMAKSLKTSQSCSARPDCPLIRLILNKRKKINFISFKVLVFCLSFF